MNLRQFFRWNTNSATLFSLIPALLESVLFTIAVEKVYAISKALMLHLSQRSNRKKGRQRNNNQKRPMNNRFKRRIRLQKLIMKTYLAKQAPIQKTLSQSNISMFRLVDPEVLQI